MTRDQFMARYCLDESGDTFAPSRLFANADNPTTDRMKLTAVRFEFFRVNHFPPFPAAIVSHTTDDHVRGVEEYARRHRCESETFRSWHKPHLTAVAIFKRRS
jgi:hypothetical protein